MNQRLAHLLELAGKHPLDALLVSSRPNVTYLSGFRGKETWLLVSQKGLYLITDSRYAEEASREAPGFKILLRNGYSVARWVARVAKQKGFRAVGFESGIVTYAFYTELEKEIGRDRLKPIRGLVESLRVKKDKFEIQEIRKSVDIAVKGYYYLRQVIRPGMTERQAQGRLEYFTKSIGADRSAFDIIIASGARSSMPHCRTDDTVIRNNKVVLVDMGVVTNGYHSDLTRPIFLGRMNALLKKIYKIVWEAQRLAIQKAAPGVLASAVDAACRNRIHKAGYGKYFGHSTGHGVGLEVHEAPTVSSKSQTVLEPGMVMTVEPGIYLPGKFGVRIEDMILITKNGNEVLTRDLTTSF